MILENFIVALLLSLYAVDETEGSCDIVAGTFADGSFFNIVEKEFVAYVCNDGMKFSTGDSIIVSKCVGDSWTPVTAICVSSGVSSDPPACPAEPTTIPVNTEAAMQTWTSASPLDNRLRGYKCSPGKSWLTGETIRFSQCQGGATWSEVLDICDEGCPIPRDCAGVAALGLVDEGLYYVVPSGDAQGQEYKVMCKINEDVSVGVGGTWTYILQNTKSGDFHKSADDYKSGFYSDADARPLVNYFVGLNYLADLSTGSTEMVLEVLFKDSSDTLIAHASYSNFKVGNESEGFAIDSLGKYHGTAGDGLCPHLYTEFKLSSDGDSHQWWGVDDTMTNFVDTYHGSYLTNANAEWQTLTNFASVEMRIHPATEDRAANCPQIVGTETRWTSVTATIPYSRTPGTIITWQCIGDLVMEGIDPGPRSFSGSITCESATVGSVGAGDANTGDASGGGATTGSAGPSWSGNVYLPCTVKCPSGFLLTDDAKVCLKYSTTPVPSMHKAAIECERLGSSMAVIPVGGDLNGITDSAVSYFAAYNSVGQVVGSVNPSLPPFLSNCTDAFVSPPADCSTTAVKKCTSVTKPNVFSHVNCLDPLNYVCEVPGICPSGFTNSKGACLMLSSSVTTLKSALEACQLEGAALVNFDNMQRATEFANWFVDTKTASSSPVQQDTNVFLGINNADGTFSVGGLYNEDDQPFMTLINSADLKHFRYMVISPDKTWSLEPIDLEENKGSMEVVCRYYGPQDCAQPPPTVAAHMNRIWNSDKIELTTATYTCYHGYFHHSDKAIDSIDLVCYGQFGGWYPPTVADCVILPVCDSSTIVVASSVVTDNMVLPESEYLNGTIKYSCPANMETTSNVIQIITTCERITSTTYAYDVLSIPDCNVCTENLLFDYSTNTFIAGSILVGMEVTVTCLAGYVWEEIKTIQTVPCTENGFDKTGIVGCYKACIIGPPRPTSVADGVTAEEMLSNNRVEAVLTYTCTDPEFSFEVSQSNPNPLATLIYTCDVNGAWIPDRTQQTLKCMRLCTDPPPDAPAYVSSNWDGYNKADGLMINYTTDSEYLFGTFLSSWLIICNGSHWILEDSSSSSPIGDDGLFVAQRACLTSPPDNPGGTEKRNFSSTSYGFVNETLFYDCPEGEATADGLFETSILCNNSAEWTEFADSNFTCEPACSGPAPPAPRLATCNCTQDFLEGIIIWYHCDGGFGIGVGVDIYNNCINGTWTHPTIPECLTITTPAPTTVPPIILATLPPYSLKYKDTADLHIGEIEIDFDNIHGEDAEPITTVNSVFGFGTGISLNSTQSQCVEKENFVPMYKRCQINPGECTEGLAFSMWVRPRFGEFDHLHLISDELNIKDRKYFMSTGGDTDGRGGISLYSNKAWITAVASTGPKYWEVTVYGQLAADRWSNLGVRFNMDEFGIELYVNAVLVGATQNYGTADAKPGLDPPTMLLGCFKSADDPKYRNFVDADLDEVAIWEKSINASRVEFFLGGYEANTSNISPDEFAAMIENIDLTDPQQQAAAADLIGKMVASQPDPTIASPTVSTTSNSDPRTTSETASNLIPSMEPMNADGIDTLKSLGHIIQKITDYTKVPNIMTEETATQFLKLLGTVSNLLKPENGKLWQGVHGITEEVGVMQLVNGVTKWKSAIMKSLDYTNVTKPICFEAIENSLYSKSCKMTIKDYRAMGTKIQEPNYNQPKLMKMRKKWDGFIVDRIVFPTDIFTDNRCLNRPVSFDATIYDTVSSSAQTPVNPMYLDRNTPKSVDARLLSITLTVDRARDINGDIDTSQPICEPDGEAMKMSTVMIHAEHETKSPAVYVEKRKLLLFEEVIETNIQQRFCVWWNENITDFGAWDKSGCELIETNLEYSKCACSNFGILTVLAVNTEKIEVPDDPEWLGPVRLALYAVSALAIIVYIILVIASGDLKDQFHLMGVNLAVAILFGSITMLITDFESIRKDRSNCAILGALIQLFYGAVGTWMLGLAHASFRGITSGVIGGCLNGYMLICWGLPIAFTGIPFILFNPMNLGNDPRCFIAWDEYVKSIFFMPQMFCVILGLFWALVVLFNLSTPALRKDNLIEDYGSFCRGAAMLVMFLAMTWSFGFLTYLPILDEPNFYPIFQVLNAVAGLCLLIFIGFGSTRFKSVLKGQAEMRREKIKKFAFGLPAIETVKKDTIGSADVVSNFDN